LQERGETVGRKTQVGLLIAVVLAAAVLLTTGPGCNKEPDKKGTQGQGPGSSTSKAELRGAGSSFVKPIMDRWIADYVKAKGGEINYQSTGSSNGIKSMVDKAVDFGATDAFLTDSRLKEIRDSKGGGEVLHVPLVMGGIVPAYHLDGVTETLNFTGEVLADIYLGKITKWNDDKLKAINKGVDLPDKEIAVVYRSDGSGSTNIFTDYLCKVSDEFKTALGPPSTKVAWKHGSGENGTSGVTGYLTKTANSIGYIELTYAKQNNLKYGKVKNKAGEYVAATLESVGKAAVETFKVTPPAEDFRFSITDAPGKESYPLSGTTWAVFFKQQPAETGKPLADFFTWVIHDGQKLVEPLDYTRLPDDLVTKVDAQLKKVASEK
jgi:phosphate transport system substrate-binding protein